MPKIACSPRQGNWRIPKEFTLHYQIHALNFGTFFIFSPPQSSPKTTPQSQTPWLLTFRTMRSPVMCMHSCLNIHPQPFRMPNMWSSTIFRMAATSLLGLRSIRPPKFIGWWNRYCKLAHSCPCIGTVLPFPCKSISGILCTVKTL